MKRAQRARRAERTESRERAEQGSAGHMLVSRVMSLMCVTGICVELSTEERN